MTTQSSEAFVYCWTDHRTDKLYVGYHKGQQNDGYVCSSKWVLEEYKKRPKDFTRMILAEGAREDCVVLEASILKDADAKHSKRFYNQTNGDEKFICKTNPHNPEWNAKISKANAGRKFSKTHCQAISATQTGKKQSPETIEKRSMKNIGKKRSFSTKMQMRKNSYWKGRSQTEENNKKNREWHLGRTPSKEAKMNMSISAKRAWLLRKKK